MTMWKINGEPPTEKPLGVHHYPRQRYSLLIEVYNLRQTLGSRLYLVDKFIDSAPQWASDQI